MVKRTVGELKAHKASGYFRCTATHVHGKEETGAAEFWTEVSAFLPGGGAKYAHEDNPLKKAYCVLEGEMTVEDDEGSTYVTHKDGSISFKPSEGRYLKNESNLLTCMLVIISYPEA